MSVCFGVVALVSLAGCKKKSQNVAEVKLEAVTEAEAREFADKFGKALQECNTSAVAALLDLEAMARLAVDSSKASSRVKKGFVTGASTAGPRLAKNLCKGGTESIRLVRVTRDDETSKALFRTVDDGFNYLEVFIGKHRDGRILAFDVYDFHAAERFSSSLRLLLDKMIADGKAFHNVTQTQLIMKDVATLVSNKKYADARQKIRELPPVIRDTHAMMLQDLADRRQSRRGNIPESDRSL